MFTLNPSKYPNGETLVRCATFASNILFSYKPLGNGTRYIANFPTRLFLTAISLKEGNYLKTGLNVLAFMTMLLMDSLLILCAIDLVIEVGRFAAHKNPTLAKQFWQLFKCATPSSGATNTIEIKDFNSKEEALRFLGLTPQGISADQIKEKAMKLIDEYERRISRSAPILVEGFRAAISNVERARDKTLSE